MEDQFNNNQEGQKYQANQSQQPPQYNPQFQYSYNQADLTKPLSLGDYLIMMLIGIIPVVNLIMLFVWAFGSNYNENKKNYARAMLIFALIGFVLSILLFAVFGAIFANMMGNLGGGYY